MKLKLTTLLLAALAILSTFADGDASPAVAAPSATSPDSPIVAQTLFSDGSTNTWTQADLIAALQLMNRRYHRDCETPTGRTAWHGALVAQIVDTNRLVKTERYADGTEFEFPFEISTPKTPSPTPYSSSNVPARLASARARRQAEKATTNTVTVVVTPDK